MPAIKLTTFQGQRQRTDPEHLEPGQASTAENCLLEDFGALKPLEGLTPVAGSVANGAVALWRYTDDVWFSSPVEADFVRTPVADDPYKRVMFTKEGMRPQFTTESVAGSGLGPYPSVSYNLGLPAPDIGGIATRLTGTPPAPDPSDPNPPNPYDQEEPETRFYVITYINQFGDEGPPSLPIPANGLDVYSWNTVSLLNLPPPPPGPWAISGYRIYCTGTGSSSSDFLSVSGDVPLGGEWTDTVAPEARGSAIITGYFDAPPENMRGLTALSNGVLAGFYGRTIYFSELGYPYAWPVGYRKTVPSARIVALGTIGSSLVILTDDFPYIADVVDPSAVSITQLEIAQACVSKSGVVDMGSVVIYPSPDGLIAISGSGAENLIDSDRTGIFTRKQWQALNPASIVACNSEGSYVASHNTGGFVLDLRHEVPEFCPNTITFRAAYRDFDEDRLYLYSSGLKLWRGGAVLPYRWRSKLLFAPVAMNLGAARVIAYSYPVQFKLYGDSVLRYDFSVPNSNPFRLPSGYRAERYDIELSGTSIVREVHLGRSMGEMRST